MRVYKRGRIYWCYVLGERQTTRCTDYEAACLFARRLEREGADPRHAAAHQATLCASIRELKAELVRRGRSVATLGIADTKLGHFARLWGKGMPMSGVTPSEILRYIDRRLEEGASRMTVHHELAHLRQLLTLARRLGRYPHHWDDVDPNFEARYRPRTRALTRAEVEACLHELAPFRAAHFAWMVATGSDLGESYRAHRGDVDFARALVHVRGTKNEFRDRFAPITPTTRTLLRFALEHAPGTDALFSLWRNVQRDLRLVALKLGLDHFSPKDLRRTYGTWLRDAGVEPHHIGRALGHADSTMAERVYARGHDEELAKSVRAQARRVQPVYTPKLTGRDERARTRRVPGTKAR